MSEKQMTGFPSIDKPWLKYYSEEELNIKLPNATLYEHIKTKNRDNLDRVCLNYYGTNILYNDFFETIDKVASALEQYGIKEGDVITIGMLNSPETIYLLFAASKIGAVANTVYATSDSTELKKYIIESNSHFVFTLDIFQDKYYSILQEAKIEKVVVSTMTQSMSMINRMGAKISGKNKKVPLYNDERFIPWNDFICKSNGYSKTVNNPDTPVLINYTGGTTGGSKGVMLSDNAILAVAEQYIIGGWKDLSRDNTWIQVLPLFIAYGVTCSLLIPLCFGMTIIVRISMMDTIAELCKKFKPNHIMYGPTYWDRFVEEDKILDLSYLIAPITGGETLRNATEEKINKYFEKCNCKYKIMNGYGMTEVGAAVSVNFKDKYEFGSVGLPYVYNVVAAFDVETGDELKFGEEGEICIQTPSVMLGYINNEEETKSIIRTHKDGTKWVHTGDLGFISEKGFIHISGRMKRYMLVIDNNIQKKLYSLDVEKVLLQSNSIENCAVVPVEGGTFNQLPVAFVVSKKGTNNIELENELDRLAEASLTEVYKPRKYYFLDKFPLTKVGKVDYLALEKQAAEHNSK